MCVTISQVQKCLDGQFRRRLLFCSGRKCSPSGQNWLSHHGESATFVWGLATYAWLLKQAPFLVETDSMSVKYIDTMKNSRGVHARWAELIGSYSFSITHAKVIMEDCVSRCPSHLPEPTQAELDMEKDWEPDPPPHLDLEILAAKSAKLQVRPERICHLEGEQICMNMMFGPNEVRVSWERAELHEDKPPDWEEELNTTINALHQGHKGSSQQVGNMSGNGCRKEKITHGLTTIKRKLRYTTLIKRSPRYTTPIPSPCWAQPKTTTPTRTHPQTKSPNPPDNRPEGQDELGLPHVERWSLKDNTGTSEECGHG